MLLYLYNYYTFVLPLPCRYDAGDNVKFNLPMAWSAHVMAWSIVDFADVSGFDSGCRGSHCVISCE
jgi:hypothetical protein